MNRRFIRYGLVYVGYLLLVLALTYPLVMQFDSAFIGATESDAYEYARHIWWMGYALQHGEPLFQHPYLGYPDGLSGWWLWAIPLQSFPAWLFAQVMPLAAAFNLMTVLRLALNGWAMYWLLRRLTDSDAGAIVGGAVYMLYPTMQGHLWAAHVGILALWAVPLYVDALLRLRDGAGWRVGMLAALWFFLSAMGSTMLLVFMLFPLTVSFMLWCVGSRDWRTLRRVTVYAGLGGAVLLAFIAPAIIEQTSADAVRPIGLIFYSADMLAPFTPSFMHPLWGQMTYTHRVLGEFLVEGSGYIGLIAMSLVVIALWRVQASRRWLIPFALAWVLSWGVLLKFNTDLVVFTIENYSTFVPAPYALLQSLPVLDAIRTPARFNLTVGFSVAVMAGTGAAWILARVPNRTARIGMTLALVMLVFVDYQTAWRDGLPHMPTQPAAIPDEVAALRDEGDVRAVFNIPYRNLITAKRAMYLQTAHEKPIIAGFVSRETPVNEAKLVVLQSTLNPALLDAAGADVVIAFDGLREHAEAVLGEPRYRDGELVMFDVPDTDNPIPPLTSVSPSYDPDQSASIYAHANGDQWARLRTTIDTDEQRGAVVRLDDVPALTLDAASLSSVNVPVFVPSGYHTLTLAASPACPPPPYPPQVTCRRFAIESPMLTDPVPAIDLPPVPIGDAITLTSAAYLRDDAAPHAITVALMWDFSQPVPVDTIRFVHLLDANNQQVVGDDTPITHDGGQLVEALNFMLPSDAVGPLTAYVGWYTYPDIVRLPVHADVDGAVNNWISLGPVPSN